MLEILDLPLAQREHRIIREIEGGNVPHFLRSFAAIEVREQCADGRIHVAEYRVAPDYLAVGSDADHVRIPLTPMAAQHIADRFGFVLPTRKMVNQIWAAALKLAPRPLTEDRRCVRTFVEHDRIIESQRQSALGALLAGIKKDVVVTPRLSAQPRRVAIYGWHRMTGEPIQPLYTGHVDWYVDYSHGVRLVAREMKIDGKRTTLSRVLSDPVLHSLLSDEGVVPLACQRYRLR